MIESGKGHMIKVNGGWRSREGKRDQGGVRERTEEEGGEPESKGLLAIICGNLQRKYWAPTLPLYRLRDDKMSGEEAGRGHNSG